MQTREPRPDVCTKGRPWCRCRPKRSMSSDTVVLACQPATGYETAQPWAIVILSRHGKTPIHFRQSIVGWGGGGDGGGPYPLALYVLRAEALVVEEGEIYAISAESLHAARQRVSRVKRKVQSFFLRLRQLTQLSGWPWMLTSSRKNIRRDQVKEPDMQASHGQAQSKSGIWLGAPRCGRVN